MIKNKKVKSLIINQKNCLYSKIRHRSYQPEGDFEASTLAFCSDWLNNQDEFLLQTSGSTGKAKEIKTSRKQMQASATATVTSLQLNPPLKALVCLNTAYIGGKMMLVRGLEWDWDLYVIQPSSNPFRSIQEQLRCADDLLLSSLSKLDLAFTALVPLQLQNMLEDSLDFSPILNRMKSIIVGGAPVNTLLNKKISALDVPVYSTYGMTETLSHIALKHLNSPKKDQPYKTLEGVEIAQDDRNCLKIKAAVTNQEWLITNDLVDIVSNNEFHWLGRIDNVINSGGVKIYPEKVERILEEVLFKMGIHQNFIVGAVPDPYFGQKLVCIIEGAVLNIQTEKNLKKILISRLNKYEIPKEIYYLDQFLRTSTNKIQRKNTFDKLIKQEDQLR